MPTAKSESIEVQTVGKRARGILERCDVVRLDELLENVEADSVVLDASLRRLLERGQIERIRPIGFECEQEDPFDFSGGEHVRLRKSTDRAYLWEQHLTVKLPVTRMFKTRAMSEWSWQRRSRRSFGLA